MQGHTQSACACPASRAARAPSRRCTRPASARCSADGPRPRPARGRARSNSAASMSSRPLFMSVAESTEILRPITQFGCAHACSGVQVARRSSGQSRNGPPDAVSSTRRTPFGVSPARACAGGHWKMALCSLSTGSSVAPDALAALMSSGPAITSDSLFASNRRLPASTAANVLRRPGRADDRGHHVLGFGMGRDFDEPGLPAQHPRARDACSREPLVQLGDAALVREHGELRLPLDHLLSELRRVLPSRERDHPVLDPDAGPARPACSRRSSRWSPGPQRRSRRNPNEQQPEEQHGRGAGDAIDAIHHAAVAGEESRRCL